MRKPPPDVTRWRLQIALPWTLLMKGLVQLLGWEQIN